MTKQDSRSTYIKAMVYLYERRLHAERVESEANEGKPPSFDFLTLDQLEAYTDPPDDRSLRACGGARPLTCSRP